LQKRVKAAARREAAHYLQQNYQVSKRRAGQLLRLSNSSLRYCSRRPAAEDLRQRLRELAAERPRYGYQRLWALLRREGWVVNHKRVYRLYGEEGLKLRKRRRRARARVERVPLSLPTRVDERYSMDFMRDTLADRRVFRTLNIVDDYTRECLAIEVDTSSPGERVVRVMERLAATGRQPLHIVVDNGPEFVSRAVGQWVARRGVNLRFIDPGKPMQNAYIESFNGKGLALARGPLPHYAIRLVARRLLDRRPAGQIERSHNLHIARLASAGLIKRFIDKKPRFDFVDGVQPAVKGGIPFDMFGAGFSHQGEDCTFETLINYSRKTVCVRRH